MNQFSLEEVPVRLSAVEQYSSEAARRYWRHILNEVERGEQVGITRYGKPLAVVVPVEWRDKAAAALAAQEQEGKKAP